MRRTRANSISLVQAVAAGLGWSVGVTLLLAALSAWMISREKIAMESMGYLSAGVLILAGGGGAWLAAKLTGRKRMQVCILTAASYLVVLVAIGVLCFDANGTGFGMTALAVLGSGCAAGLAGAKGRKTHSRKGVVKMYKKPLYHS